MIDEYRTPFILSILNDSSQAPMRRPVRMLDGCRLMVIGVVIAIVIIVVGRGEVDVRRREDRGPDGGHHQNRCEERTPHAACAHAGIMRVSRRFVNSTTWSTASRDGNGHAKQHYITMAAAGADRCAARPFVGEHGTGRSRQERR